MRGVILSLFLGTAPLAAQTFAETLDLAQEHVFVGEWTQAARLLSALRAGNATDSERVQIAAAFESLGQVLSEQGQLSSALSAHQASLAERQRVNGDRDHDDVVRSLTHVGVVQMRLGRAGDALPALEQALAMVQRLDQQSAAIGVCVHNLAYAMMMLGRVGEALPHFEAALAAQLRSAGDGDDPATALLRNNLARCLAAAGRVDEALAQFQSVLAMRQRLYQGQDHPDVAASLGDVATCLARLGRAGDSLPIYESALAMVRRLAGDQDHREVAVALVNLGACLRAAGRLGESLRTSGEALAMHERLLGDVDHPDLATAIGDVADSLKSVGRLLEAQLQHERSLAMQQRLHGGRDHPSLAHALLALGACCEQRGRPGDALPRYEMALAMHRRLFAGGDHFATAASLSGVGTSLLKLGRVDEALPVLTESLEMRRRLLGGADHTEVAMNLNNIAMCLQRMGRLQDAQPSFEAALAMHRRQSAGADSPEIASSLANLGYCLESMGRSADALPLYEASRAMADRLHEGRDHVSIVQALNGLGSCLASQGRLEDALQRLQDAMAMAIRCDGGAPGFAYVAVSTNAANVLAKLGRTREALDTIGKCVVAIEQLRHDNRISPTLRQAFFDDLKQGLAFERMQDCAIHEGEFAIAFDAVERSRSRDLLDVLEEQRFDAFAEGARRARQRGDEGLATRLLAMQRELAEVELASDRLLHEQASASPTSASSDARNDGSAQRALDGRELASRRRQLLDERARLLGDVLLTGRTRTAPEVGAVLANGELLLQFTITAEIAYVYVLGPGGDLDVTALPLAHATTARVLPGLLTQVGKATAVPARGRDPDESSSATANDVTIAARELFGSLVPPALWSRIRQCKRVFIAAHRDLHSLPFELLVTDIADGRPVHWLDAGPPISYVPSGSALHWMRQRSADASDDSTSLDLLAIGDPQQLDAEPELPEQGVLLMAVADGGEGALAGLRPRDVLLRYDGHQLPDGKRLRELLPLVEAAIEDGTRPAGPIHVEVWRRGEALQVEVPRGRLGVEFGADGARAAHEASLDGAARMQRIVREGDVERLRRMPPLRGARIETQAITDVFANRGKTTESLIGVSATEPAVFELAPKAKFLHFACHGIAEEYAGQSLSMLVLAQPDRVLPGDDGLLKLSELLGAWGGRLSSCRLVVLSACRTNVGPTNRDDAPQALPLGFLCAGAPAVISSLWAVDDESTKDLMTDFYGRLLAGETDVLKAFTDSKRALRAKYSDPFHWAPFLFMGAPK